MDPKIIDEEAVQMQCFQASRPNIAEQNMAEFKLAGIQSNVLTVTQCMFSDFFAKRIGESFVISI